MVRQMLRCAAALLLAAPCAAAQEAGWEDALAPRGGRQLGVGGIEFRGIESVTAKSPVLTIVGRALVDTFCSTGRCPNEKRAYERVTLVIDTNKRGFRGGGEKTDKTEWGTLSMTRSLSSCGRLAARAKDFDGDYIQLSFINAHDYLTTVFRRSASEARIEFQRAYDANRGDGLDCLASFIDKGKAGPDEMAWPPVPPKRPARPEDGQPARFTAAFLPLTAPKAFQEDMNLFVDAFVGAISGPGAYSVMEQGRVNRLMGGSFGKSTVPKPVALKVGKQAGVDQVLVARSFFKNGGGWQVWVECYDVATGKQVASAKGGCPGCVPGGGLPDMVAHGMANAIRKKLKMPLWTPPPQ